MQSKQAIEEQVAYIESVNQDGLFSQCAVVMPEWNIRALNMLTIKPANDTESFHATIRFIEYRIRECKLKKRRMEKFKRVAKSLNQRTNHDIARG